MALRVAIVGAGPAAFYTAEALLATGDVEIDIIERLPTPYGLIRAGVAPDHQSTKKVAQKFERMALAHAVHFFGNVELGRDVALAELRAIYDAVVLAIGSPCDRALGIPGEHRRGVYGSSLFVGWYNGHPDFRDLEPIVRGPVAVVVGNGNVALDVARVLVMSEAELAASDIPEQGVEILRRSGIEEVVVVGRRGPAQARFANVELRELLALDDCVALADPTDLAGLPESISAEDERERRLIERNLALFRRFTKNRAEEKRKRLRFRFFSAPVAVTGDAAASGIRLETMTVQDGVVAASGRFVEIPCQTIVTAIGYRCQPIAGLPFDPALGLIASDQGRIEPGLYVVGWAKRGPSGVISSNRPDGEACAAQILADVTASAGAGRPAFTRLLADREIRAVSFADWRAIDEAELAAARPPAPRRKFTTLAEMLAVLDRPDQFESRLIQRRGREAMSGGYAGDIDPKAAWELLCSDTRAVLVDVRTPAEWAYVGVPNLSQIDKKPVLIPWIDFPAMQVNQSFVAQAGKAVPADAPVVLLCRSGVRSRAAAIALTAAGFGPCYNIATGFEGDPDAERHRGTVSGWKVDGLPWLQT